LLALTLTLTLTLISARSITVTLISALTVKIYKTILRSYQVRVRVTVTVNTNPEDLPIDPKEPSMPTSSPPLELIKAVTCLIFSNISVAKIWIVLSIFDRNSPDNISPRGEGLDRRSKRSVCR
jgi:hypothetical protein